MRAAAQTSAGADDDDGGPQPRQSGDPQADQLDICTALAVIPNDCDWDRWNTIGLATWRATAGYQPASPLRRVVGEIVEIQQGPHRGALGALRDFAARSDRRR